MAKVIKKLKKLTWKEAEAADKRMWTFLAETGKTKSEWPEWDATEGGPDWEGQAYDSTYRGIEILHSCFCCAVVVARLHQSIIINCSYCPKQWVRGKANYNAPCEGKGSPYKRWGDARTVKTRKKWAAIIRDLPWRKV